MSTFENKPPGPIERVLTKLHPKGVDPRHVPGSGLGLKPCDYAAMAANITHPDRWLARLAECVWLGKYLEQPVAVGEMAGMLHLWGGARYAFRHPQIECSGMTHEALAALAAAQWCSDQEITAETAKAALRIGYDRWKRVEPLLQDLRGRLYEAEQLLVGHLRAQLAAS